LIADLKQGRTAVIPNLEIDPRTANHAAAFASIETRSLLCVPLVKEGKFVALFVFHHNQPRDWSEHDHVLAEQIAERTWFLVENARAEASLRESRDVLSLAMRGGRMGAWSRNMVTNEVWWSRELEELFGLAPGGFEGSQPGFRLHVHEEDKDRIDGIVADAVASGSDYVMEFRFKHADGSYHWMEGRGRGIYGPDGSPRWLYGIGIDITERKTAEAAIAAARTTADADAARLNLALEAARLGDWSWDIRTDLVTLSPRAAEIFGLATEAVLPWEELRGLLHADDREATQRAVHRAIKTRGQYFAEYRVLINGRERWVLASGLARYDAAGVTGMFGVLQEISGDRLLVRLDDAVRGLVDAEAITYTAARLLGDHLAVNRCAYATVHADQDTFDLTGNYTNGTHSIIGRYRFRQFGAECLRLMRAGEPYVVADARADPRIDADDLAAYEQTAIRAVICVPVLKSGQFVAAMAVHTIEPREWTAQEVELLQRVASRCWESLERARVQRERASLLEAAEAANRAKDEFMAMLGHELRNPLSPILTALQLMKLRGDDSSLRERVVIERQVTHLTRLVDDLLDVSRIARGKVELKTALIELPEIVARAIEVASPLLEQRTQTLTIEAPRSGLLVDGDSARLTQIISNLLTNASKYTAPGGHITVSVASENGDAVVRVRDNGVGIAADVLPRVFDLFVQGGQAIDRAEGGLGLGLTIVRSLTERHGGSVSAHSDGPGKGSEFVVRLPIALAPPSIAHTVRRDDPLTHAAAATGIKVLIVDDNVDAAEMLAHALGLNGHHTWIAHDGPDALRKAVAAQPAAAFLDIGLPVMDGYELATRLRETPGLEGIRLVAVTGYGQESDRQRSAAAGFHHHLVKPVDLDDVNAVLEGLIGETSA
jgi:PAS domain S-box-containing protein